MLQEITEISASQKYPIGMRYAKDVRAFRYAHVGDITRYGATYNLRPGIGAISDACPNVYTGATIISGALGSKSVVINMTTHVNSMAVASAVAANDYEDGYFTLYLTTGDGNHWGCKILRNTAEDGVTGYVTLTLEDALPVDLVATDIVMVEESPYWSVNISGGGTVQNMPVVGIVRAYNRYKMQASGNSIPSASFLWLQTWGPCPGMILGRAYGNLENERYMTFADSQAYPNPTSPFSCQPAGWFLPNNYNGGTPIDFDYNYSPTVFLVIAP